MWFVDILLIIVGLAAVVISFKVTEKKEGEGDDSVRINQIWSPAEERTVKERLNYIIKEKIDDAAIETEDRLSTVTNEKIMAVSEMSDQVLHKIDKNHSDIVFLYNMLNEKENEIKEVVHLLDKRMAGARNQAEKERAFVATLKKIRMVQGEGAKEADMEIGESQGQEKSLLAASKLQQDGISADGLPEEEEAQANEEVKTAVLGRQAAGILERRNASFRQDNEAKKEGKRKKTALEMIAADPEGKEKISPTERYRKLSVSELMELTPDEMSSDLPEEEPEPAEEEEKTGNVPAEEKTGNEGITEKKQTEDAIKEQAEDRIKEPMETEVLQKEETAYSRPETPPQENPVPEAGNRNQKIIDLYKEGKSILEISKMLEIGQGEVKFVINLSELTR